MYKISMYLTTVSQCCTFSFTSTWTFLHCYFTDASCWPGYVPYAILFKWTPHKFCFNIMRVKLKICNNELIVNTNCTAAAIQHSASKTKEYFNGDHSSPCSHVYDTQNCATVCAVHAHCILCKSNIHMHASVECASITKVFS